MRRKSRTTARSRGVAVLLTPIVLFAGSVLIQAQNLRPEGGSFDASRMTAQSPPPQGVAVKAGRLFDARAGKNLTNQVILIKGDRITDVGPADKIQIPPGVQVIDLSGATVLPGLIDRHVHLM